MKILTITDKNISDVFKGATKKVTLTNIDYVKCTGDFVANEKSFSFTFESGEYDKEIKLLSELKINLKTGYVTTVKKGEVTKASSPLTSPRPFI